MSDSLIDALLKQSAASDGGDDEEFLARVEATIDGDEAPKKRSRLLLINTTVLSTFTITFAVWLFSRDPAPNQPVDTPQLTDEIVSPPAAHETNPISLENQETIRKADSFALRGSQLIVDGDLEGSIDQFREGLRLLPDISAAEPRREAYSKLFAETSIQLARQRADEGRYPESISLIEEVLNPSVDIGNIEARGLLADLNNPNYYSPPPTPSHLERARRVSLATKTAQGYVDLGDTERAVREFRRTLNDDHYISATRSGMEISERHRLNYFDLVYDARRAKMLREVAEGWETPETNTTPIGDINIDHDLVATGSETPIKMKEEEVSRTEFFDALEQLEENNPDPVAPSETLAVVNGEQISQSMVDQFIRLRVKIWLTGTRGSVSKADAVTFIRQVEENALDDLIEHTLLLSEFERRGGDIKKHYAEQSMAAFVENHFGGDHAEFEASLERSQITKADFQRFKREEIAVQAIRQDYLSREDFSSFMVGLRKEAGVRLIRH